MKIKALCLLIVLLIGAPGFTRADEPKPKIKTLSKEEAEKSMKVGREFYEAQQTFQQAVNFSLTVPLDDCSKVTASLANIRIASERLSGVVARQNDLKEALREAHDCKGCEWSPDGKSLVQPPTAPGN